MKKSAYAAVIAVGLLAHSASAVIISGSSTTYYSNPLGGTENIASFDWDAFGNLYWMGGDASWAQSMSVHKYDGSTLSTIDTRASYSGSWVASHGNNVYFDDGSAMSFNKYDTSVGGAASQVFQQNNAWGYTFNGDGLFISAADASYDTSLYYSEVAANGDLTGSLVNLGYVGNSSGPIAFDADGNLFYGGGYGATKIYKYSATDVADAMGGTQFGDASLHEYIDSSAFGYAGATGMDFDSEGNLVATMRSSTDQSSLVSFDIDESGSYLGTSSVLAQSDGRFTTVRNSGGSIYVSDSDGIYAIPEPGTVTLMLVGFGGMAFYRRRRKYFMK